MSTSAHPTGEQEVAILSRIFADEEGRMPAEIARFLLDLRIADRDRVRMHTLAVRNQEDDLTSAEKEELQAYGKATTLLSILKSRARRALGVPLDPRPIE